MAKSVEAGQRVCFFNGLPLGMIEAVAGELFCIRTEGGAVLWIREDAIYEVEPAGADPVLRVVTLVCDPGNLHAYEAKKPDLSCTG